MSDKPVIHGGDHRPGGQDPTPPGSWIYVADSSDATWDASTDYARGDTVGDGIYNYTCVLANGPGVVNSMDLPVGVANPGVSLAWTTYWVISEPIFQNGWANEGGDMQIMRFRISVGHYNELDRLTGDISIHLDHQLEIQGSVTGGISGSIVFVLPPAYWPENDLRLSASDDSGLFIVIQVLATGNVIRGL